MSSAGATEATPRLLNHLVVTSATLAATSSRKTKTAALADLFSATPVSEIALAASLMAGTPRQGRIGVGWATLGHLNVAPAPTPSITLLELDALFDEVEAMSGPGSVGEREARIGAFFELATTAEADFLKRLFLGDLRQGANESLVVDGLAQAAGVKATVLRRALMLSGDLGLIAETALESGADGLAAISLEVGRPLRPMLASTAPDVASALDDVGEASVEWKLDGARIQCHRRGNQVNIWTRNLNEVTSRLPDVVAVLRSLPCSDIVLDGEVLGWSTDDTPQAFQDTMSSFGTDTGAVGLRPMFFDILHLDGADLVDAPQSARRAALEGVAPDWTIPGEITADPERAQAIFDAAIDAGHEGAMVKKADASYEAGRRGKTWRKVKPVHTLDLVVLGAEWGHGRRQGWLSNLHLGARGADGELVMVGKTFKGLTDDLLRWQTEALLGAKTHEQGITVFVRPEFVVEIALDGVQSSTRYPGGVALRFARVRRYREDKVASEADTIATVQAMLG